MGGICSFPFLEDNSVKGKETESLKDQPIRDVVYLNHAGQARLSSQVTAAGLEALHRDPWNMSAVQEEQDVRELFARLISAPNGGKDIAVMPSTAFAITLAAHNIIRLQNIKNKKMGGKILLIQDQYPSAVYPWQEVCNRFNNSNKNYNFNSNKSSPKWTIHVVPYPEEEYGNGKRTWTESILEHLSIASNHNVRVVCLPPLHWADGRCIDLESVAKTCHERQIDLVVDATQAVGIFPLNVQKIRPTMLACSSHKWLGGPSGVSLVYIDPQVHERWHPLDQHERGRNMKGNYYVNAATRHFMNPVTGYYPETFFQDARKFDAGGKANPTLLPMLRASLLEVVEQDAEEAQRELGYLIQPLLDWCHKHKFVLPHQPHANHLIGLQPPPSLHLSPQQLVRISEYLDSEKGVVLQARCGGFRVSPGINETRPRHIRVLIDALDEVLFGGAKNGVWAAEKEKREMVD